LPFNFVSEFVIREVQETEEGLDLNGAHKFLVYVDDFHLLGGNINIIKENTKALLEASKEVGLEVNIDKNKYMFISRDQTTEQNHCTPIGSLNPFGSVASSNIWEGQ
jgi:hypothetical protein